LALVVVLFSNQAFSQDDAPVTTQEDATVTHDVTASPVRTKSTSYVFGTSYSFRDSLDKFWIHFSPAVNKTGWLGPSVSISSLMIAVMTGPDGMEPYNSNSYRVHDSTTGGIGFFGNCGIKFGQGSLITSGGLEVTITEEQRRDRYGYQWNAVGKVLGRPVGMVGLRLPFISQSDLELGYKTNGTTFVSLLMPLN
jgi:hypothetical protein